MVISYWTIPSLLAILSSAGANTGKPMPAVAEAATINTDHRKLQDEDDPCIGDPTVFWNHNGEATALRPSFFTECASSLEIDSETMKSHIESLNLIFKQYHCFYDIAKNPAASIGEYQSELGHTIYGEGGGQVDIDAELNAIVEDIDANGASMATFWKISVVFNKLHDGHVLPQIVDGNFNTYLFAILPERFIGPDFNLFVPRFFLDDDQNMRLTIVTQMPANTGPIEAKNVTSINGLDIAEYITYLANNPELNIPYQDLGARVNALIKGNALFSGLLTGYSGSGTPSNLLPDDFVVEYQDGTSETYVVGIKPSDQFLSWARADNATGNLVVERDIAEDFINLPGEQFSIYQEALGQIEDLLEPRRGKGMTEPEAKHVGTVDGRNDYFSRNLQEAPVPMFNMSIPDKGGVLVQDDYVVMKLSTFNIQIEDIINLWAATVTAAKENDINKLMIDISDNGGGSIAAGTLLIMMMFPDAGLEWFADQWDISYNDPMREYLEAILPLVEIVLDQLIDLPDEFFVAHVESFTDVLYEVLEIASSGILELCTSAVNLFDNTPTANDARCETVDYLQRNVTSFIASRDLDTYINVLVSLLDSMVVYNPWSVVLAQVEATDPNITSTLISQGVRTFIRGGVESNVTAKFDLSPNQLILDYAVEVNAALGGYTFDDYVIVSNGVSGSMAAIFPFESSQLYKNRDQSGVQAKVTLAAYGGTGNADDFSISSFPASVQGVHLEDPIIGDAIVQMFATLLPTNVSGFDAAIQQVTEYSNSVAEPPFFNSALPLMPVVNFYNAFMEPGALPLQFVNIPVDAYIPEILTRVTFQEPDDLLYLYDAASSFFSDSTPTTPAPVETTAQPITTPAPVELTSAPVATPAPIDMTSPPVATPAPIQMTSQPVAATDPPAVTDPPSPSTAPGPEVTPAPSEDESGSSSPYQKEVISSAGLALTLLFLFMEGF